jgi:hypothetical protein
MSNANPAGSTTKRLAIGLAVSLLVLSGGFAGWQLARRTISQAEPDASSSNEAVLSEQSIAGYLQSQHFQALPGGKFQGERPVSINEGTVNIKAEGRYLSPIVFTQNNGANTTYAVTAVNLTLADDSRLSDSNPDFISWNNSILLLLKKQGGQFVVIASQAMEGIGTNPGDVGLVQTGAQSWGWTETSGYTKQGYSTQHVAFYGVRNEKIASLATLLTDASDEGAADCSDPDSADKTSCTSPTQLSANWKFLQDQSAVYAMEVTWQGTVEGRKVNETHRIAPRAGGTYAFPKEYNEIAF